MRPIGSENRGSVLDSEQREAMSSSRASRRSTRPMLSRWLPRAGILIAVLAGAYLAVLVYPQPLFAFALDGPVITLHADRALPAEARDVVACATAKVRRSPLFDEERHHDVYISADAWRWRIVANVHPGAGAVALAPIGRAVFVRRAHIQAREGGCRQRGPRAGRGGGSHRLPPQGPDGGSGDWRAVAVGFPRGPPSGPEIP